MSASDPLVGKVLNERFEILERIGEGGTGVVYKAKQLSVDRIIAIKVLGAHVSTDPQWVRRFHNEARAASRLDHPNTVRLIDFGQTKEGLLFIAMEYLHGRSLRAEIDRLRRIPFDRALRILSQICSSLAEAHSQGIIHRDIKPDNIHLVDVKSTGDFVKVLDFSVAKLNVPDAQLTRAGVIYGTPAYMSPEQGRGSILDARSDIYAVGIVAYEMLTGHPPFDAKIPTEVVMMHMKDPPPQMTGVPPRLTGLVLKALAKDPMGRQQTATELDTEIQECFGELFGWSTPSALQRALGPDPGIAPPRAPSAVEIAAGSQSKRPLFGDSGIKEASPQAVGSPISDRPTVVTGALERPSAPKARSGHTVALSEDLPPLSAPEGAPPAARGGRTMVLQEVGASPDPAGGSHTMMLADPLPRSELDRVGSLPRARRRTSGLLYWMIWLVAGIGVGLALHLWRTHHT